MKGTLEVPEKLKDRKTLLCLRCVIITIIFEEIFDAALNNFENFGFWVPLKTNQSLNMPVEDMEEQGLSKIPDLGVAQLKFQLQHLKYSNPTAKQQVSNYFVSA